MVKDRSNHTFKIDLDCQVVKPLRLDIILTMHNRTLNTFAFLSGLRASYAISVRRASTLPMASFRFHLAMDTLAIRLTVPPAGPVGDLHPQVGAPCRAHKRRGEPLSRLPAVLNSRVLFTAVWRVRELLLQGIPPPSM